MVSRINAGASPVIRLSLGLFFFASVMAFDMTLNTNVCPRCGFLAHAEYLYFFPV